MTRKYVKKDFIMYELYEKGKLVAEIAVDPPDIVWFHYVQGRSTMPKSWFRMASMADAFEMLKIFQGKCPKLSQPLGESHEN